VAARLIITLDGPAGAGKSTVAQRLARELDYLYVNSGALYRGIAWQMGRLGLDLQDAAALHEFLQGFQPLVAADAQGFHLVIDGVEVREELQAPVVSHGASQVARQPEVRQWVKVHLRRLARDGGVVTEGRDQGTVVFPQAQCKFYLDAALEIRAQRRRQDWQQDGAPPSLEEIMAAIAARDEADASRDEAPLKAPPDAVVIDTSHLDIGQVVQQCLARIKAVLGSL
jgi:cytidylate kinase